MRKTADMICKQLQADVTLVHQTELLHELQSVCSRERTAASSCAQGLANALNTIIKALGPKTSREIRQVCSEQLKTIYNIFSYARIRPKQYPELYEEFAYASHLL